MRLIYGQFCVTLLLVIFDIYLYSFLLSMSMKSQIMLRCCSVVFRTLSKYEAVSIPTS